MEGDGQLILSEDPTSASTRATVPQTVLWQRLAFPYAASWTHVLSSTVGHGQPPNAVLSTTLAAREAVMRGRARALPFFSRPLTDRTLPPPGAVLYLDFCGPMIAS